MPGLLTAEGIQGVLKAFGISDAGLAARYRDEAAADEAAAAFLSRWDEREELLHSAREWRRRADALDREAMSSDGVGASAPSPAG